MSDEDVSDDDVPDEDVPAVSVDCVDCVDGVVVGSVGAALLVATGVVAAADVLAAPCSPIHSAPAPIPVAASAVPAITPVATRP
ncbi:hypothetical protein C1N80_07770 [Brachybacterium sp. SGAir0954]|uniref:hypothetical protein n=1 Tax=Brachybacterium sp. SGAir0954 TaxID=2571029 RepID=UPI0010CD5B5E|nr:hypothetical protein [Brachybacterium sp. SGAir0954]QCR53489.1 hypothetical protein C1N80_07770 [Brachybacterium sp. SGAir0954]